MDNYIMLNGKKIELTPEQVKLIQAEEPKKSPFDRAEYEGKYYYFGCGFDVHGDTECAFSLDTASYNAANYCTDENIMKQHALHMLLNNLLWRYSMTHGGDKIDWHDKCKVKYRIFYNFMVNDFQAEHNGASRNIGAVYFADLTTAEAAIEEIVKPFVAEHPDFDVTKM